jgi:hypothetical protein
VKEKLKYIRTTTPGNIGKLLIAILNRNKMYLLNLNDDVSDATPDYVASMDDLNLLSNVNVNINVPITEQGILKCMKLLKRNKECW